MDEERGGGLREKGTRIAIMTVRRRKRRRRRRRRRKFLMLCTATEDP